MIDMENIEESNTWLVLVLKEKYATDADREQLKACLLANFPLKNTDVRFVRKSDENALSNFVFVREYHRDTDLKEILAFRRDYFEAYPVHMRITETELKDMMGGIEEAKKSITVKYGDIVVIKSGIYSKLHGIVLRENRSSKIEVGMKFCFGTVVEQYSPDELEIKGNIFKYLKVLK